MIAALVLIPVAYLLGTFPSAVIVARSKGIDIHTVGSGNPGASNVARVLGAKYGALVFLLDALKGAIPAVAGLALHSRPGAYVLVTAAILGHMFPATRGWHGGKGAATLGGAILALFPIHGLILLAAWIVIRKLTGTASVATFAIIAALIIDMAVRGTPGWEIAAIVGLSALVLVRHAGNIRRLVDGRELSATGH